MRLFDGNGLKVMMRFGTPSNLSAKIAKLFSVSLVFYGFTQGNLARSDDFEAYAEETVWNYVRPAIRAHFADVADLGMKVGIRLTQCSKLYHFLAQNNKKKWIPSFGS